MNRRLFINKSLVLSSGFIINPYNAFSIDAKADIKIGIIADLHQDIIHDGSHRLKSFINNSISKKCDFIIQLGDFSLPRKRNEIVLDHWNLFDGNKYHVLGNHDMVDYGFTKAQTMSWWGMKERYYSFNRNGYHFIILDGNDENPKPWNEYYNRYIGPNQKKWLVEDLKKSYLPTIIFSHQSLDSKGGIFNQHEIRKIVEDSIFVNGNKKVIACICGHHHDDYLNIINDIAYVHINSASYKWVGEKYKFSRFSKKIENDFPSIVKTCPYKKPLFTTMHINSKQKTINFDSKKTSFIKPSPKDLQIPGAKNITSEISKMNYKF